MSSQRANRNLYKRRGGGGGGGGNNGGHVTPHRIRIETYRTFDTANTADKRCEKKKSALREEGGGMKEEALLLLETGEVEQIMRFIWRRMVASDLGLAVYEISGETNLISRATSSEEKTGGIFFLFFFFFSTWKSAEADKCVPELDNHYCTILIKANRQSPDRTDDQNDTLSLVIINFKAYTDRHTLF